MKIATSPFVYRWVPVFMPEKLGNLQEKKVARVKSTSISLRRIATDAIYPYIAADLRSLSDRESHLAEADSIARASFTRCRSIAVGSLLKSVSER